MEKGKFKIKDPIGFHARPAGLVSKEASNWVSSITFEVNGKSANAKSMISIMSLGAKNGQEVEVKCEGQDAKEALASIMATLKKHDLS